MPNWPRFEKAPSTTQRFRSFCRLAANGCWIWIGARDRRGYGRFSSNGLRTVLAHRWAYERVFGGLDYDLVLHHDGCSTQCVNPTHLVPMTQSAHMKLHRGKYGRMVGS